MRIPKRYGQSRLDKCPFCESQATTTNVQGIPVCSRHTTQQLTNLKCACGMTLDIKKGPYGPFCTCLNCGAINLKKVLSLQ
ncbi:hypothetical protein HY489_05950 [Candidatus Woesearchaeota archaeon]|nr:hypothetical protein [Candidatus Woesearchaeota archaeon]